MRRMGRVRPRPTSGRAWQSRTTGAVRCASVLTDDLLPSRLSLSAPESHRRPPPARVAGWDVAIHHRRSGISPCPEDRYLIDKAIIERVVGGLQYEECRVNRIPSSTDGPSRRSTLSTLASQLIQRSNYG